MFSKSRKTTVSCRLAGNKQLVIKTDHKMTCWEISRDGARFSGSERSSHTRITCRGRGEAVESTCNAGWCISSTQRLATNGSRHREGPRSNRWKFASSRGDMHEPAQHCGRAFRSCISVIWLRAAATIRIRNRPAKTPRSVRSR